MDREQLGRIVRAEWVRWAQEQPNPKSAHLVPWKELDEANKEVDRRIGEAVAAALMGRSDQGVSLLEVKISLDSETKDWRVFIADAGRQLEACKWDVYRDALLRETTPDKAEWKTWEFTGERRIILIAKTPDYDKVKQQKDTRKAGGADWEAMLEKGGIHFGSKKGQYHDADIVGYWIRSAYYDPKTQDLMGTDQVVCADCWERYISHGSFVVKRSVTFAETAEQELVCSSFCHLQLPTRGEP